MWRSPDFFKKSLGPLLKTRKYKVCPVNSDTIVHSHNQVTFSNVKMIRINFRWYIRPLRQLWKQLSDKMSDSRSHKLCLEVFGRSRKRCLVKPELKLHIIFNIAQLLVS